MGLLDFIFGGGGDDAYERARADEERRRAEIQAAQRQIEAIFSSPERLQQYEGYEDAIRRSLLSDLDRERDRNARELKFSLARSGLSRGSTDIDQNRLLSELYLRGVAEAERQTQQAGGNLRSSDQQAKQQLFSQLLAGADSTTAVQNAGQMMRTNAQLAQQDAIFSGLDKLFGNLGDYTKRSREAAGERRAEYNFGSLFGPRPQTQTAKVAGGVYGGYS